VHNALGDYVAGIMGNDASLLNSIKSAGEKPAKKYGNFLSGRILDYLKSDIADLRMWVPGLPELLPENVSEKFVNDTPGSIWISLADLV